MIEQTQLQLNEIPTSSSSLHGLYPDRMRSLHAFRALVLVLPALLLAGYLLLTLGRASLWLDEAWVATGVLRGQFDVDTLHTSPIGFVLLLKAATQVIGSGEFGFRFPALVFFVGSVVTTGLVARRWFGGYFEAAGAVLLIGTNFDAAEYARNVKPYTADAFFAVLILFLASRLESRWSSGRWLAYGLAISVAPAFSFTSLLVSVSTAVFLLVRTRRDPGVRPKSPHEQQYSGHTPRFRVWLLIHGIAAVAVGTYGLVLLRSQHSDELLTYWASGFPPDSSALATILWSARQMWGLLAWLFTPIPFWGIGERVLQIGMAIIVGLGIVAVARTRPSRLILVVGPAALLLVSAILRLYPFDPSLGGRLALFLLPGLCILAAGGIGLVGRSSLAARSSTTALAAAGAVLLVVVVAGRGLYGVLSEHEFPSVPREELRELVVEDLLPQVQEGDSMYVYFGAVNAFEFYAPAYRGARKPLETYATAIRNGVDVIYGTALGLDASAYSNELRLTLALQPSRRFWIVLSHISDEREAAMAAVIPERGSVERVWRQPGAALYLVRPSTE